MGKVEEAMVARLEESGGGNGPRSQGMCVSEFPYFDCKHLYQAILHTTMRRQVIVVADTACDGMSTLIKAREESLEDVVKELKEVQNGLEEIISRREEKP